MGKRLDLTGQTFGRLTVLRPDGHNKSGRTMWLCRCCCGTTKSVSTKKLRSGDTVSGGCFHRERLIESVKEANTKHGMSCTRLFNIWTGMRKRCLGEYHVQYNDYGGRGITVCVEWNDFSVFQSWALDNGYSDDLTLDRIDVNGHYCPDNCRWASYKEQSRNRRNNRIITYNGESRCSSEWAELIGITKDVLYRRLKRGWTIDKALTQPLRPQAKRNKANVSKSKSEEGNSNSDQTK